ncbi:MFS transporter [Purpureocillium lilacinum]|uniref:MFS transporter n=2 Tax=Purpureocillium lilacinum TaxID=33203 RepID=A0A179G1Z3_PURLI|nr:MFS transporter [Purpureocillium lilacinum]OAQ71508.1 MFS transporter [Purpureocillium lilacinum]PWI73163.1 MFS transporter [Purpureocillium lilacinum]GJN79989.1 hypothetical protein PLIIFM63780_003513 [Purpureocillium lilacinum]
MEKSGTLEEIETSTGPKREDPEPGVVPLQRERVQLTDADNKRILRKTDKHILTLLFWIYFLQIFDKAVFGTAALFHLKDDVGLTGTQFSLVASISSIAQLAWQPFSSFLIVKVPPRILMPTLVLGWGIAEATIAAGHSFGSLLASRFFLGLFEAGCLPLFSIITSQWYRRVEQPLRVAVWYSNNGTATILAGILAYGLGHIPSDLLKPWQIIFLFAGLLTIVSAPLAYWKLDNGPEWARFLTELEKRQAVERLRANQTGTGSRKFKWSHLLELAVEPKSYLWIGLSLLLNIGAAVSGTFGPLILSGFGFDAFQSSLLNMPFGAVQLIVILSSCWIVQKVRLRSVTLFGFMIPVLIGSAMLYALPRGPSHQGALLAAYYLIAFLFAGNTLLISWIVGNTAGTTKSSATLALFQVGSSAGNIIGPLLFNSDDAPLYHRGLRAILGVFVAFLCCVIIQLGNLFILNKVQAKKRVRNGKHASILDHSMTSSYEGFTEADMTETGRLGDNAFDDLTDGQNDEFIYLY